MKEWLQRGCRTLLDELFAKLHDINTSQSTTRPAKSISISYLCAAELTTRLIQSHQLTTTTFLSHLSTVTIQTVASSEVIYVRPTVNTVFINKHCCSSVFMLHCTPTVWNSLPSFVRTADSFTSFRSQLKTYMFVRHL